jgi:hypothetical protein
LGNKSIQVSGLLQFCICNTSAQRFEMHWSNRKKRLREAICSVTGNFAEVGWHTHGARTSNTQSIVKTRMKSSWNSLHQPGELLILETIAKRSSICKLIQKGKKMYIN